MESKGTGKLVREMPTWLKNKRIFAVKQKGAFHFHQVCCQTWRCFHTGHDFRFRLALINFHFIIPDRKYTNVSTALVSI